MQKFTTAFSWTWVPGLSQFNVAASEAVLTHLSSSANHVAFEVYHPNNNTFTLWNWGCYGNEIDSGSGLPVPELLSKLSDVPEACSAHGARHLVTANGVTCVVCDSDPDNITCWVKGNAPVTVAGASAGLFNVTKLAAGAEHVCAMFEGSTATPGGPVVACFGSNEWGALGQQDLTTSGFETALVLVQFDSAEAPTGLLPANPVYPVVLNCGPYQCIVAYVHATTGENHVWTWGYGSNWNLGFDPATGSSNIFEPRRIATLPAGLFVVGDAHVSEYAGYVLCSETNTTFTWGDLSLGASGAGITLIAQVEPEFAVRLEELADVALVEGSSILAIKRVGESVIAKVEGHSSVFGWGANYFIELGLGPYAATIVSPRVLPYRSRRTPLTDFETVFTGERNMYKVDYPVA